MWLPFDLSRRPALYGIEEFVGYPNGLHLDGLTRNDLPLLNFSLYLTPICDMKAL